MTRRRPIRRIPLWCAGLLALNLAGCAGLGNDRPALSWVQFLAGDDLAGFCMPGSREVFRIVFYDREPPRIRLFEVVERPEGGAIVAARTLDADDMAGTSAGDTMNDGQGRNASLTLPPLQFAQLAYRLDKIGAFDMPIFGPQQRPRHIRWLITGCHGGEWFFNAYAVPSDLGLPASLR